MAEPSEETLDAASPCALDRCEKRIGYKFRDQKLLEAALTHASGAEHRLASNERMEFLGDAILGYVVCEQLYLLFPNYLEGDLTKLKSMVVSRQTCAKISKALGMRDFLILGKGMTTHPAIPNSLFADVLEFFDRGHLLGRRPGTCQEFIANYIGPEIELARRGRVRCEL